jgi:hypothetical protein
MPGKLLKFAGYVSIGHEAAAKCQIILARALNCTKSKPLMNTEQASRNPKASPQRRGERGGSAEKNPQMEMNNVPA